VSVFDVAIVGGGIIGSSIALELAREKLRVVLLDREQPWQEASWAAAGMLSPAPDSPDSIPLVPLSRASLELYPDFIAVVEEASGRRVGCRREGTLEIIFAGDAERELSTLIALHHGLGLPTEALRLDEAHRLEPALSREARAAALLPYEASVDPRALAEAVLGAASKQGVAVRAGTAVTALVRKAGRCVGVVASGQKLPAGQVVLAAGCYSGEIEGLAAYAPMRPVRGQMVALRSSKVQLTRVLRSGYGYVVPRDSGRPQKLVAGSTLENVGFEKGLTPAGLEQILHAAQELVPGLDNASIVETWSGLRPDTPDHMPILGATDIEGLTIATGHYRNGILLAPITAKLIREWLTERRTSLPIEAFSPLRFLAAKQSCAAR
jgi:glycine oxidase